MVLPCYPAHYQEDKTDYVVSVYPSPPHTIHPPHQIATILEESVIHGLFIMYLNVATDDLYQIIT